MIDGAGLVLLISRKVLMGLTRPQMIQRDCLIASRALFSSIHRTGHRPKYT